MNSKNRFVILAITAAVALSAPAFAQDQAAPATPAAPAAPAEAAPAPAPAAAPAPAPKPKKPAMNGAMYKKCVAEKMTVAEAYCSANSGTCDAEKAGVKTECASEAKGVKHKE